MTRVSACRVCLSSELNMYAIADTPLQAVYEKLTGSELQSADARPACVCYICLHQLRKCDSFIRRAVKADTLLTEILDTNLEITKQSIESIDKALYNLNWTFEISNTCYTSIEELHTQKIEVKLEEFTGTEDVFADEPQEARVMEVEVKDVEIKKEMVKSDIENEVDFNEIGDSSIQHRKPDAEDKDKPAKNHPGGKPYKCEYCSYSTKSKGLLMRHNKIHKREKKLKRHFMCEFCSYFCTNTIGLKRHVMIHTGEKPFKCKYCSYSCITKGSLTLHTRVHTGEKPYKCESCSYSCTNLSALRKHIRTHTGEKPYACEYCGHAFNNKNHLAIHIRTHTGEKPYKCDYCGSSFNARIALTCHIRTHTGERPYKCKYCSYSSAQNGSLASHMRTRHK